MRPFKRTTVGNSMWAIDNFKFMNAWSESTRGLLVFPIACLTALLVQAVAKDFHLFATLKLHAHVGAPGILVAALMALSFVWSGVATAPGAKPTCAFVLGLLAFPYVWVLVRNWGDVVASDAWVPSVGAGVIIAWTITLITYFRRADSESANLVAKATALEPLLLVSGALAITGLSMPDIRGMGDEWNYGPICNGLLIAWIVVVAIALIKHRAKGLFLLFSLPLIVWWPLLDAVFTDL